MKTKLYLLLFGVFSMSFVSAQTFYGGEIQVKQLATYSVGAVVEIITSVHDTFPSIELCWGDGICEEIPQNSEQVLTVSGKKYFRFEKTHTYGVEATYDITVENCCWAEDILNITAANSEDFLLKTSFFLSVQEPLFGENHMPNLSRAYVEGNQYLPITYISNFFDNENDDIHFEVCTIENVSSYVPINTVVPGTFNTLLLDTLTSDFNWISPQLQGDYVLALCMNEFRNNMLISSYTRYISIFVDEPLSNHEIINDQAIKISPNPASDQLYIEMPDGSNNIYVSAFDASGKKVLDRSSGNKVEVSNWSSGFYFLLIEKEGQLYSQKVIID